MCILLFSKDRYVKTSTHEFCQRQPKIYIHTKGKHPEKLAIFFTLSQILGPTSWDTKINQTAKTWFLKFLMDIPRSSPWKRDWYIFIMFGILDDFPPPIILPIFSGTLSFSFDLICLGSNSINLVYSRLAKMSFGDYVFAPFAQYWQTEPGR